jgi:hypothetical protein
MSKMFGRLYLCIVMKVIRNYADKKKCYDAEIEKQKAQKKKMFEIAGRTVDQLRENANY